MKKALTFITLSVIVLIALMILLTISGVFGKVPRKEILKQVRNYTATQIYTSDNYLLGRYYLENRSNISIEDVPDFFIKALIATEDARFYNHRGTDTRSIIRVVVKSIILNKDAGGGSTITQQLAKNLYPRKSLGILTIPVAKIREVIIAKRLEEVYTKTEILQLYLNTVPFGDNTYGVETASLVFFNKKPKDLLPQESAVLVGMLKGNTDYNPMRNYQASFDRRNVVLNQMVKQKYLSKEKAEELKLLPLKLSYHRLIHDEGPAPYFREHLRHDLIEWCNENPKPDGTKYNIYTDGLRIYTTIDYTLQRYAEKAVSKHMTRVQKTFDAQWKGKEPWLKNPSLAQNELTRSKRYKNLAANNMNPGDLMQVLETPVKTKIFTWEGEKSIKMSPMDSVLHHFSMLQAGLLSIESHTGFVKAWVGGIDYRYFKYDHVTSHRQAGSTFKPIVYAAALDKGVKPCDFFANDSIVYEQFDNWKPKNAIEGYGGYYSVKGALTHSINTVSVKLLMLVGPQAVVDLAKELGFQGDLPAVPSLALGSGGVSVFELVQAYSIFLNKGHLVTPVYIRRIEDQNGNVLFTQGPQISEKAYISESTAEAMTAMLCNVVNSGTASALRSTYNFKAQLAGKTGTTQDHADGWFMGVSPDLITGVWVGGDNPVVSFPTITYGQGAYMALPIFALYMQQAFSDPVYNPLIASSFNIAPETEVLLNCDDYKEEEFESIMDYLEKSEQNIVDFIKRIFRKKSVIQDTVTR
jgi:penicillin-binding protein 1A